MAGFDFQAGSSTCPPPSRPVGPQDWEAKRERIARYYLQEDYTLDELQAAMLQRHGFNATKRQYCTKLKQWNLRKNIAASDKDEIIDRIVAARILGRKINEVRFDDRRIDLKSLLKHAQSQAPYSGVDSIAEQIQHLHRTLTRQVSARKAASDTSNDHIQIIYEDTESSESGLLESESDKDGWTVAVTSPVANTLWNGLDDNGERFDTPRIHPALAYAPTLGLEKIINLSQNYVLAALELGPAQLESAAMHGFWVNVKNALYMAKKHERDMTFEFASRACATITAPTSVETSLGTLKDVLATLSPTNTSACPPLRHLLLQYLSEILSMRFGIRHPLVLLCGELRQETSNQTIYETALRSSIELMETALGSQTSDTVDFRRELIRLLRRSGDLYQSEELCVQQEAYCVREFGNNAFVTRRATSDLVHVLMAKKELAQAMAICEDLIERSRRHLGRDFPDQLAVYALEDLAELCELQESPGKSNFLLHEAYFGAVRLWGAEASSAEYILSKIQAASNQQRDALFTTTCL